MNVDVGEAHGLEAADVEDYLIPIFDRTPLDSVLSLDCLGSGLMSIKPGFVHLDPLYPFEPMTVSSSQLNQVGAMLTEVQRIIAEREAIMWITAHMNQTGAGAVAVEWGNSWCLHIHRRSRAPPTEPTGSVSGAVESHRGLRCERSLSGDRIMRATGGKVVRQVACFVVLLGESLGQPTCRAEPR